MRYRLVPGLLSERAIECDDTHHKLVVNPDLVPLSVIQYKLMAALLRQRQRWEEDPDDSVPLIVTVQQLQLVAGLARRKDVKKYLCSAAHRAKLARRVLGRGAREDTSPSCSSLTRSIVARPALCWPS